MAALPWPVFNSLFSSPELCSCLQGWWVKVTPGLEMQTVGSGKRQVWSPPTLLATSPWDVTHFSSPAAVFRTAPVLLNPLLPSLFPSLLCPAVSNPQFLSRLYLPRAFPSPSDSYSKNRSCFADVRKKYLADGFFSPLFWVCSKLLHLADCCTPCQEPECSSRAPHWPAGFVPLFWTPISRNWCSSVRALNKNPSSKGRLSSLLTCPCELDQLGLQWVLPWLPLVMLFLF